MRSIKSKNSYSLHDLPLVHQIALLSIFPMSIIFKIVQFKFLPQKFFFDSANIMNLMDNDFITSKITNSFDSTALLFRSINILNCSSLLEWSILIASIFNIYMLFKLSEVNISGIKDIVIVMFILAITNIYIFNISKDIIQFVVFAVIALVNRLRINDKYKAMLIIGIFYIESISWRSYYILTALFFACVFIGLPIVVQSSLKNSKKIILIIFSTFVFLFLFMNICKYIRPEDYKEMIEVRNRINQYRIGSENAKTAIFNLIDDNGKLLLFLINYFINAARILFPFSLLTKGVYYFPFFVFQIIVSFMIIYTIINYKKLDSKTRMALFVELAYLLVAFLFEPDFGSFIRHEAATAPMLITILFFRKEQNADAYEKNLVSI